MLKRFIAACLLSFIAILPATAQSPMLPILHPVYDFLDRLETLGLLDHPLLGSKPVSRLRVARLLDEIQRQTANQVGLLSRVDQTALEAYRWEFQRDLFRAGKKTTAPAPHPEGRTRWGLISDWMTSKKLFTGSFYRDGLHLYSYESPDFDAYADPRGSARLLRQKGDERFIAMTSVGVKLQAHVRNTLGIYFDFEDIVERGRGPYWSRSQLYQDRFGYVSNPKGENSINYDVANFDLAIGGDFWEAHTGKMPLRWGPGHSGQLLLSDWTSSFHQVQVALNLGKYLRFVYVFGNLHNFEDISDSLYISAGYIRKIAAEKYLAAHRLEWDPHPRLRLAFSEAVVFGERPPELAYLIPVNFFYSAQHDLGDEDNTLMCFDASWIPLNRGKLYGQLLIDDMSIGKLRTNYYGNKLGWLGGITYVEPLGFRNFDATLELAQLRPFVYTHQYPVNVYSHWMAPLGYRYPPNSEVVYGEIRYRPHRRVLLQTCWTHLMHGVNTDSVNAGGDLFTPHQGYGPEAAPFLGGLLQRSDTIELQGTMEVLENLSLWGRGALTMTKGSEDAWEWEMGFRLN